MSAEIRQATHDDDAGIRALLRDEAMPGQIRLSYQREPDFFAGCGLMGEDCRTLVAVDDGVIVGVACRSTRMVYVHGEPCRIGYLGQLRVASSARGRWLVSRGFQALRRVHEEDPLPAYLLSIVDGNREATGVLRDRRRRDSPVLHELAQYRTLALTIGRQSLTPESGTATRKPEACELAEVVAFLNAQALRFQLAAVWTLDRLQGLAAYGLTLDDLRIVRNSQGELCGVAALWDQRRFKQTVVESYAGWLGRMRPAYNLAAGVLRRPRLPAPGEPLRSAYLSLFGVAEDDAAAAGELLHAAQAMARARGLAYLIAGFDTRDPLLAAAARLAHVPYTSRLYLAHWPDAQPPSGDLVAQLAAQPGGRAVRVDAATL